MAGSSMSNYAQRMARLSARIFGEVTRPTSSKSMKIVKILREKPMDLDENIVNYYPPHPQITKLVSILRDHGLFRDEHADFKDEMARLRKLRGKEKTKPGQWKLEQKQKEKDSS